MTADSGAGSPEPAEMGIEEHEMLEIEGAEDECTTIESVPLFELDLDTDRHEIDGFPGYEPGFAAGWKRGIADSLEALRTALIEGGTDPGTAFQMAERVGRAVSASNG
jgi:hypothetical protein